jgi:hypothetical protein
VPPTPDSISKLFRDLTDSVQRTITLVNVSASELARLEKTLALMDALHDLDLQQHGAGERPMPDDTSIRRLSAALPVVLAQRETGFPFLYGLATIAVWSELEAFVEDVATEVLLVHPPAWERDALRKLKVSVADFARLEGRPRCEWIVQALQKDLAVGLRVGPGILEPLLEAIGLGGSADARVRASLVELSAVRNILVHRRGRADSRFLEQCPWVGVSPGAEVLVSGAMLHRYAATVLGYAGETMQRVHSLFGDQPNALDAFLDKIRPLADRAGTA